MTHTMLASMFVQVISKSAQTDQAVKKKIYNSLNHELLTKRNRKIQRKYKPKNDDLIRWLSHNKKFQKNTLLEVLNRHM